LKPDPFSYDNLTLLGSIQRKRSKFNGFGINCQHCKTWGEGKCSVVKIQPFAGNAYSSSFLVTEWFVYVVLYL